MSRDGYRLRWQGTAAAPLWTQFLRFAMVGASGTAVQYLVLWFGVERCAVSPAAASGAGYALAAVVNYILNYFLRSAATSLTQAPPVVTSPFWDSGGA